MFPGSLNVWHRSVGIALLAAFQRSKASLRHAEPPAQMQPCASHARDCLHRRPQGAFLHRDYLQLYTAGMPPGVHEHVDAQRNCEDIAMACAFRNLGFATESYC